MTTDTTEKGLESLILALIQQHGPVGRSDVNELLIHKLPDRLSDEQKRRKVHNLLQELRRAERIANAGSRTEPRWVSINAALPPSTFHD